MKYNSKFKNIISGFTLLEALMAVSILMVAVVAPITVSQKGLSSAVYAKSQMIASYLAQDAIEYIKNVRDQTAIQNNFEWDRALGNGGYFNKCLAPNGCMINTIKNAITENTSAVLDYSNTSFLYKDSNGFYGYGAGGEVTNFTRQIKIKVDPTETYKALVTVTVNFGNDKVVVKTLIFNY
jgi:Tfp pilus assembly protein PilV